MLDDDLTKFIKELLKDENCGKKCEFYASVIRAVSNNMKPVSQDETAVVALENQRTAAIFYDRVWSPEKINIPYEIGFFSASKAEAIYGIDHINTTVMNDEFSKVDLQYDMIDKNYISPILNQHLWEALALDKWLVGQRIKEPGTPIGLSNLSKVSWSRFLSQSISENLSKHIHVVYSSLKDREAEYKPGNNETIISTLSNLSIVKEDSLTWEQVIEFRSDPDSKQKVRRLKHWFDESMVGQPQTYIEDEIGIKLDDYRFSLQKHGLETAMGTISTVFDSRNLFQSGGAVGAASLLGEPLLGLIAGGIITIGKVSAQLTKSKLDLEEKKRTDYSEVAVVHELSKLSKK